MARGASASGPSMSTITNKFQKLKMEIRAILISSQVGETPEQLEQDYMDLTGYPIPYDQFGFMTLDSFLNAISDTVEKHELPNGTVILSAIIPMHQ